MGQRLIQSAMLVPLEAKYNTTPLDKTRLAAIVSKVEDIIDSRTDRLVEVLLLLGSWVFLLLSLLLFNVINIIVNVTIINNIIIITIISIIIIIIISGSSSSSIVIINNIMVVIIIVVIIT
jgi:hypothetical protein